MSARPSFARLLVFAGVAAASTPGLVLALAPLAGAERALAIAGFGFVAIQLALLGDRPRAALGAPLLALALGAAVLVLGPGPGFGRDGAFLGAAAVLGVCRAACFGRASRARTLATELALGVGGLVLARAVAGPGLLGAALGVWAFHLVQALYPLSEATRNARGPSDRGGETEPDAFERSRARLTAWLDDAAVD